MKTNRIKDIFIGKYRGFIFCCIFGLFVAASFPRFNLFFLIWIAFLPLLSITLETDLKKSFLYGFISGFIFNCIGFYWLVPMLKFNTGSLLQAILSFCFLSTYLSLYFGIWSVLLTFVYANMQKVKNKRLANYMIIVFATTLWIVLEYVRTYLFTGFSWMLLGYSQFKFTEIIQVAEICGVYGVSALIIFCNMCFYFWIKESQKKYLYIALSIVLGAFVFGILRIEKANLLKDQEYSVSIVQPGIDQNHKWDSSYREYILEKLRDCSVEISKNKTDLVIWPETVLPGCIPTEEYIYNSIKNIVKMSGCFNIVGSVFYKDNSLYNATLAFHGDKDYIYIHIKNHLVPFGEFIPFKSFLSKFFGILNQQGDFTRGTDTDVFKNGDMLLGTTICSENFSPDISRRFALAGAKVLTNQSNDAWFFDTAELPQHFIMNVFRAIENRKSILVSNNSGISGIISESGYIINQTMPLESTILTGNFFQNNFKTFYTKYGDVFAYACIGISVAILFMSLILKVFNKGKRGFIC